MTKKNNFKLNNHCESIRAWQSDEIASHSFAMTEYGRSMVEMLGVLAVMGVLSVAGIAGFNSAMNRHRANELLYEASKRATVVAMQVASGNGSQLFVAEFGDNSWNVTTDNLTNQFGIKSPSVGAEVCRQVVNSVGTGTVVRKVLSGTTDATNDASKCTDATITLVYNNDLSATDITPAQVTCEDSEKVEVTYTSGACCTYQKTEKVCPGFEPPACTPAAACECTTQDCCTGTDKVWTQSSAGMTSVYKCLPQGAVLGCTYHGQCVICNIGEAVGCSIHATYCTCGPTQQAIGSDWNDRITVCTANQKAVCTSSSCTCEDL